MLNKNHRKILITIATLLLAIVIFISFGQLPLKYKVRNLKLDSHSIFLIERGTTGKAGNISKTFNLHNPYASHLGIGLMKNDTLTIYHVDIYKSKRKDNLYVQSINDFVNVQDINYLSVWKLENVNDQKFRQIKNTLLQSENETFNFDFNFEKDNKQYYCSEYVVKILEENAIHIFKPHSKKIEGVAKQFLGKNVISYYPVDSFEKHKSEKIFEWLKK